MPNQHTHRFTDEDLLNALRWADEGMSREHIAEMLSDAKGVHVSKNQVCGRLHRIKTECDKAESWRAIGSVASEIVGNVVEKRLGPKAEHSTKETGRDGATNTDPALTETTFHGGT